MKKTILLGGQVSPARARMRAALEASGCAVIETAGARDVPEKAADLALVYLPNLAGDGLDLLRRIQQTNPRAVLIAIAPAASGTDIASALRGGVVNVLTAELEPENAVELVRGIFADEPALPSTGAWGRKLDLLLARVAKSDVPVLLQGETGVGKEVLARRLHAGSPRASRPFLKLNCAALPSELVESELFGYERGAFTGAFKTTMGKFELANEGTILLDEIGDMDFKLQAKLLQVVQDHEFLRLGAKETSRVDVRVMSATHCDLEVAVADGRFREDLYYRLNIIEIRIPPLRDRQDEILPLAEHFLSLHGMPGRTPALTGKLRSALAEYPWPGNIRELENVMRRYLVLEDAEALALELSRRGQRRVASAPAPPPAVTERRAALGSLEEVDTAHRAAEAEIIINALDTVKWNRKRAAALLGIDYKALLYRMKKLGIGQSGDEEPS